MADPIAYRRAEQARLLGLAREYVEALSERLPLVAAAVVGSVARGDFNLWSDIDVVVVADDLPRSILERQALLLRDAAPGIQPIGFEPAEFRTALAKRNRLACEAVEAGVMLAGSDFFEESNALRSRTSSP